MQYLKRKAAEDAKRANNNEFQDVKNFMMTSQIQCFKYNSSLDKEVQKVTCNDAFISLSADGKELIVTKRVPITDEADAEESEERYDYDDEIDVAPQQSSQVDDLAKTAEENKDEEGGKPPGLRIFTQLD